MQLWTDKYKPKTVSEIVSQKKVIDEVMPFLHSFKSCKAMLLYGQPGTGKSLLIEILSNENDYDLLRLDSSESRKSEDIARFSESVKSASLFKKGKVILIDDIDHLSRRDKGASAAIIELIKKSRYPVFLTAIDPWNQKLSSLRNHCKLVKFNKVSSPSIAKQLKTLCQKEGITASDEVLKTLAKASNGDLRSAINDLQIIAYNKKEITPKDLEILGERNRNKNIFESLPKILRSESMIKAKKVLNESDKDVDDIFLWIENNAAMEFSTEDLPRVYELLSVADMMREHVIKQQNWRFKGIMADLLSGISSIRTKENHKFIMYKMSDRISLLGRTRAKRAEMDEKCKTLTQELHCSSRKVKTEYLPYMEMF